MNIVLKVHPHQCRVQGHDHLPTPAGRTISDASWPPEYTAGCSAGCRLTPPGPFLLGSFPATLPQACSVAWG